MKVKKFLFAVIMSLMFVFSGCGKETDNDTRTKLKFYFYQAGYGDQWATALSEKYNSIQDKVKIIPYGDYDMYNLAFNEITRGTNVADIYTLSDVSVLSRAGKLLDLSSLYSEKVEEIDGQSVTVDDIVEEYAKKFNEFGGKNYGLPWFGTNMSIIYNVNMFTQNNWSIPSTMEEFFELCGTINNANINVKPLVFCGSTDQGYIPGLLRTWLWQAEGDTNMQEFLGIENVEVFQEQEESRTKIYETVAELVKNPEVYLPSSNAYSNQQAQRNFIQGKAAMIINGSWLPTEMDAVLKDYPNFKMAMMPIPHINSDKKGKDGTDTSDIIVKDSVNFVIPSVSENQEEAKKFLVWMLKQENLQMFAENCNGTLRPYRIFNPDDSKLNEFAKSVYNIVTSSRTVTYLSDAPAWKERAVSVFAASSGEYVTALMNAQSLAVAKSMANGLAKQDYTINKTYYDLWLSQK